MNLGSIIVGLIGHIFGNKVVGKGNFNEAEDGYWESTEDATNLNGALDNLGRKISGSGLTRAERQANAFTAQREDIAWQRQMQASNTAYQRQVADMQAAGLNPMLALGAGGASSPSTSTSGSVTPGNASLGSLLDLISLPSQLANLSADTKEKRANAAETEESTREKKLHNDFFELTQDLEYKAKQRSLDIDDKRIEEMSQAIAESRSRVDKNIAETKESEARANLAVQQSILANANARNIEFMQPYLAAESDSRAKLNEAQTNVAIVDAAYRQKLIDSGTIEAAVRASNANASESEIKAQVAKVEKTLKEKDSASTPDPQSANICERIVAGIRAASRAVQGK